MFIIPDSWYRIKTLKKKGRGVFALRDIPAGTVIGDYIGTIIPFDSADENKLGLYDMAGGNNYDILANPKKKGIQLINHSCMNSCGVYPYNGHMLYFVLRKIFAGEEITVDYGLYAPGDKTVTCSMHVCHCGSKFCTGTMHEAWQSGDAWDALVKRNYGKWYNKIPGKYGTELEPLGQYPQSIADAHPGIYHMYGAEGKPPLAQKETSLPAIPELRKRIRETGRRLSFPKMKIVIDGVKNDTLLAERS